MKTVAEFVNESKKSKLSFNAKSDSINKDMESDMLYSASNVMISMPNPYITIVDIQFNITDKPKDITQVTFIFTMSNDDIIQCEIQSSTPEQDGDAIDDANLIVRINDKVVKQSIDMSDMYDINDMYSKVIDFIKLNYAKHIA
jgi:hypothetical protein